MSAFSPELKKEIESYLGRYETKRSSIIPILNSIQDKLGWVSNESIEVLKKDYDFDPIEVREVLTFYSLYHQQPPAKNTILFCNNIVCHMMGANAAMEKIENEIQAYRDRGEEPPFSLEGVPCLGVCDKAPAILVNKDRFGCVTADKVPEVLAKYK